MRINSINSFNTNPLAFGSQNKNKSQNNGMLKATKAIMLATALSATAGSCDKLSYNVEHNHYFKLPTDTFTKTELKPTPVPPQVIIIEKEVPGKTDTIIQEVPVPQPPDTVIIEKPVPQPPDTVIIEKPVPQPPDTVIIEKPVPQPPDTIIIEKPPIIVHDTIYQEKPPIIVYDTIYLEKPPIHDTIFIEKPPIIQRDTLWLKPDTVWMKEDWTSPVPPKQEEIYDDLGLIPTGDGKFYIAMSYYDNKNSTFIQRRLDGQASSRDGKILVYNVVKTKWDNEAEGVVLGKNETFEKQLVYLSEDGANLGMKIMQPKVDIQVENSNNESNWQVFDEGTLSTPDAWQDAGSFFTSRQGTHVELTNGFKLEPGMTEQSVTTTNPYGSEWELKNWNIIKGDAD